MLSTVMRLVMRMFSVSVVIVDGGLDVAGPAIVIIIINSIIADVSVVGAQIQFRGQSINDGNPGVVYSIVKANGRGNIFRALGSVVDDLLFYWYDYGTSSRSTRMGILGDCSLTLDDDRKEGSTNTFARHATKVT